MRKTMFLLAIAATLFVLFVDIGTAAGSYVWPVAGEVLVPYKADGHRGIDIAAAIGDSVVSAQDGNVIWVGKTPRGESCITIEHPDGISSTYLPVKASVCKGQKVESGDVIGTITSEGDPSSPETHLHFGLYDTTTRDDKTYLNPAEYLKAASVLLSSNSEGGVVELATDCADGSKPVPSPSPVTPVQNSEAISYAPESISAYDNQAGSVNIGNSGLNYAGYDVYVNEDAGRRLVSENAANAGSGKVSTGDTADNYRPTSENDMVNRIFQRLAPHNTATGQDTAGAADGTSHLLRDDTYHGVADENVPSGFTGLEKQTEDNNGKRKASKAYGNRLDRVQNSQEILKTNSAGLSNGVSSSSLAKSRKRNIINEVNPFVSKKACGVKSSNASFVSDKSHKPDEFQNTPDTFYRQQQGQQAAPGWIGKAASWEGLPDAIAFLAIMCIVMLSAFKFMRNVKIDGEIMPVSAIASC